MSHKPRPALIPVLSGVSVNPATAGPQYQMSFPSNSNPSFERTASREPARQEEAASAQVASAPATDVDAQGRPNTGNMYDPVRHDTGDSRPADSPEEQVRRADTNVSDASNAANGANGETATPNRKRAREDDPSFVEEDSYMDSSASTPAGQTGRGSRSANDSRKSHLCDHCGATFTRQHNLKSHMMTHTSSKKEYVCTECNTEFRRLHDLKRHEKLHTGEKPFACEVCGRRFARADALARHTKAAIEGGCVNSKKSNVDFNAHNDSSMLDSPIREPRGAAIDPIPTPTSKDAPAVHEPAVDPSLDQEGLSTEAVIDAALRDGPTSRPSQNDATNSGSVANAPFVPSPSAAAAAAATTRTRGNGAKAKVNASAGGMAQHPMLADDIHSRFNDLKQKHDQLQLSHERMTQRLKQLEATGEDENEGEAVAEAPAPLDPELEAPEPKVEAAE